VHSAQGCTFTEPFTIWEAHRMERRILYTAVGRAQRLEQVHLPPNDLRRLEFVDEAKEARDLHFIKAKLDNYKQKDKDKGRHHEQGEYPPLAQIMDGLIRCGYCCERCQREVKLIKNFDPQNRDPTQAVDPAAPGQLQGARGRQPHKLLLRVQHCQAGSQPHGARG
jgi:hypothetical protein